MKKRIPILLILAIVAMLFSKAMIGQVDSSQTYISFAPCVTNEIGPFTTKFSPTFEIGKQFDGVLTTGLAIGKTNMSSPKIMDDIYLEFRPNLNVFQVGKFTNTITPGVGYVFGPNTSLILEWSSGIEYAWSDLIHINVFFGNYYYSGFSTDTNAYQHYSPTFFGFSIVKFFEPVKMKGLLKLK
jgi:hypothetical protein